MNEPIATAASPFQAGLLCPACQQGVVAGEAIVTCPACSTTHHATCWAEGGRCSSYHCDTRTRATTPSGRAEIVVTALETERIVVPPPRVPTATADLAARQQVKPTRWSTGAIAGFV